MKSLTRKQRELQQREAQILKLARPILLEEGYAALSMDRLAGQLEYAKGTLYNHFPNKEDIVAALALGALRRRCELFSEASMAVSGSRRRMVAIGVACDLYACHCRADFLMEMLLRNSVIWEKVSGIRQQSIRQCETSCMGIVAGVVRDAVAAGDLRLPQEITAEEVVFGFWSLTYGAHALVASSASLPELGVVQPSRSVFYHGWTLLNGFAWLPEMTFEETSRLGEQVEEHLRRAVAASDW
jgi:AcrR family transcriptional regulator